MAVNRVPLSPGVYTSERELSFNAPSIGATTLATVGETPKGPAQQPIFVEDYTDYQTYFGGLNTEVFSGTTRLKYEQQYIAKNWLAESNSMWVVRPLGYAGYDAGAAWNISVDYVADTGNVFRTFGGGSTDGTYNALTQRYLGNTGIPYMLANGTMSANTLESNIYAAPGAGQPGMYSGGSFGYESAVSSTNRIGFFDGVGAASTNLKYGNADSGSTSWPGTIDGAKYLGVIYSATTYGGAGRLVITGSTGGVWHTQNGLPWVSELTTKLYPLNLLSGRTFVITTNSSSGGADPDLNNTGFDTTRATTTPNATTYPTIQFQPAISVHDEGANTNNADEPKNLFHAGDGTREINPLGYGVTGHSIQFNWRGGNYIGAHTGGTTGWTAATSGTIFTWSSRTQNMVVATLRSRGKYTGNAFTRDAAAQDSGSFGNTDYDIAGQASSPTFGPDSDCNGTVASCWQRPAYTINTTNYKQTLHISGYTNGVSATNYLNNRYLYKVNLDPNSQNYITKVLGTTKYGNSRNLWVEEIYPNTLKNLSSSAITFSNINIGKYTDNYRNYTDTWQPLAAQEGPTTPWIVSEIMGNTIHKLFRVILIPDGDDANSLIKISIKDVDVFTKTFTLAVREFSDTDSSPRILESYINCSMNPVSQNYIGKKIGTENGDYAVRSKYIMLELDENAPINALPSGFQGVINRWYSGATFLAEENLATGGYANPTLETEVASYTAAYNNNGPKPFYNLTYDTLNDDIKKTYLGWSDKKGIDASYFTYKGLNGGGFTAPYTCGTSAGAAGVIWTGMTKGFHFDKRVSGLTTSDAIQYEGGAYAFYTSGSTGTLVGDAGNYYTDKDYLKFTVIPYGGFDGWDAYRLTRTNADTYIVGSTDYGSFWYNQDFTTSTCQSTDWYAYYDAMRKLSNPEETPSSVFTTPGIDYVNNLTLVNKSKEMIENDKGDSLYIVTSDNPRNQTVESAVDNLENAALSSSYMATYWPWVRYNDTENNVRIYIPPTANVVRNIALTDNVSYPWFATAGQKRGKIKADRAQTKLTQSNRDDLYESRINPIATFSGQGVLIWGNKTLLSKESALDRINVRRLMLDLKTKVKNIGIQLLFEQNDAIVRQQFLSLINPVLEDIRANRGLTDFKVELNSDVNELDTNSMTGKIFVKPTRTLEFIEIEFNITPTSTSFTDIG